MERRLTAILAADVVGYSRLMGGGDEESILSTLNTHRSYIDNKVELHGGRVFGSAGDSVIAEFPSPVEAVRCAVEVQQELENRNAALPEDKRMRFRIGVHLGDVIADNGNLLGDGVNIAARLEAFAPPGGICISRSVADQVLGKVDVAFANAGAQELKNIHSPVEIWVWPPERAKKMRRAPKAWRLVATVTGVACIFAAVVYLSGVSDRSDGLSQGARIVIVPFKNVGNDAEDAYFSEGLTRDLNALLARFSNLFVIAPEAAAHYRDDPSCEAIRGELGADYILAGTVRRSQDHLRVTTTFTDAQTCRQLTPPGPFDRDLSVADVLDIQVEIARKVAAQIGSSDAPLFSASFQQAIRDKAPENLEAYECYLLGFWFYQTFSLEAHRKARDCLIRTVEEEPGYSLGWSRLAFNYLESKKRGFDTPPDWARLAREAADRALVEDRENPEAYYAHAILSQMVGDDKSVFLTHARKAIDLNPNDSWILADLGIFLAYSGEWEKGKEWITRARELNPKLHPGYNNAWALHAILQGNYDEAQNIILSWGTPSGQMSMTTLTASYAWDGEHQKAQEMAAVLRERFPEFLKDPSAPYRARGMPRDLIKKLMDGLRKAGLDVPEEGPEN